MNYKFNGDWEFKLKLAAFTRLYYEGAVEEINLIIRDFLDEEIEPFSEQINTINYVIENQSLIVEKMLETIWKEWGKIFRDYSLDDYNEFPSILVQDDLTKVINIKTIYIQALHKDGYSYFGLEGSCMWDEEHGLGFIFHKDRLVGFGGAEEADAGGREIKNSSANERPSRPEKPRRYRPHPQFGTIKPSHQQANIDYPHELIKRKLNDEFINYIEEVKDVDFIHPHDTQNRTYLQSACFWNNESVFNYLINKVANLDKAIYKAHKRKNISFIDQLISKGANIHETRFGRTILTEAVEHHLRLVANNLTEEQMDENYKKMQAFYNRPFIDKNSPVVIEMLEHPKERIKKSKEYILWIKKQGVALDEQKIDYVKHGSRGNQDALNAIEEALKGMKE